MNKGNKESKLKGARAKPKTSGPRNQPLARVAEERARARALARVETAKRERERAMEILAEGRGGPMSEFDRVKSKL